MSASSYPICPKQKKLQVLSIVLHQQFHPNLLRNQLFTEGLKWNIENLETIENELAFPHNKLWDEHFQSTRYGKELFGCDSHLEELRSTTSKIAHHIQKCLEKNPSQVVMHSNLGIPNLVMSSSEVNIVHKLKNQSAVDHESDKNENFERFNAPILTKYHDNRDLLKETTIETLGKEIRRQHDADNHEFYQKLTLLHLLLQIHSKLTQYQLLVMVYRQRKRVQESFRSYAKRFHLSHGVAESFATKQSVLYQFQQSAKVASNLEQVFLAFKIIDSCCIGISRPVIGKLAVCSEKWCQIRTTVNRRLMLLGTPTIDATQIELQRLVDVLTQTLTSITTKSFLPCYRIYVQVSLQLLYPLINFSHNEYFAAALGKLQRDNAVWITLFVLAGNITLQNSTTHDVSPWIRWWFFNQAIQHKQCVTLCIWASHFCKIEMSLKRFYDDHRTNVMATKIDNLWLVNPPYNGAEEATMVDLHEMVEYSFHLFALFNTRIIEIVVLHVDNQELNISQNQNPIVTIANQIEAAMVTALDTYHKILKMKTQRNDQNRREEIANNCRLLWVTIKQGIILWEWLILNFDPTFNKNIVLAQYVTAALHQFNEARGVAETLLHYKHYPVSSAAGNILIVHEEQAVPDEEQLIDMEIKHQYLKHFKQGNTYAGCFLKMIGRVYLTTKDGEDLNNPLNFPIITQQDLLDDLFESLLHSRTSSII